MAKVQISIRVDADDLAALERLGHRDEMIGAALRDYVQRHGGAAPPGTVAAAPVRRTAAEKVQKLAPPPGKPLSPEARRTLREFDKRKRK